MSQIARSPMGAELEIVGVHRVASKEPCHLVEIELRHCHEGVNVDFGSITQETPYEPESNWQVAYDEQFASGNHESSRWVFFFHYLRLDRPLATPFGPLAIPDPTPLPERLSHIRYVEP